MKKDITTLLKSSNNSSGKNSPQDILRSLDESFPLLETINDAVIFLGTDRSILYANKAALKILGVRNRADVQGKTLETYIVDKDKFRCITYYDELAVKKRGKIILAIKARKKKIVEISSSTLVIDNQILCFREMLYDISSVKEMEHSLDLSEAKQFSLINYIPGIVYYARNNKDYTLFYSNKYIARVTGYPYTDFTSNKRSFMDQVHPDDLKIILPVIQGAIRNGQSFNVEYRVVHKNGTIKWLNDRGQAVKDSAGNMSYITGISIDITDKKNIEEKNRQNEERLNAVFENPALGVVVMDKAGKYIQANKTAEKIIGYSRKDLLKLNVSATSHPDDLQISEHAINEMLVKNKKTVSYEKRMVKKDGHIIWVRVTVNAISDRTGHPKYLVAFGEDITAEKAIRERLEESEERYRTLVTSMPDVVFNCTYEPDWEMFYISDRIKNLSGFDASEFLKGKKKTFASIMHPLDRERIKNELPDTSKSPRAYALEYRIIHKDKSIKWVHEAGQVYFDKKLKRYCLTGVMVDITSRINAEENQRMLMQNLQRAYKEVNEFAHIVSHDLKAPLRGISSLSTWLYEDYYDKLEEEGRKNLLLLQDRVEKMDALIDGILAYSSVGKGSKQIEDVNLNKVLQSVQEMLELPAAFKIIIRKQLPTVRANNYHMYQLFQNLISNAIKYNDKDEGKVWIDFRSNENEWGFSVKDNGIGIAKEYQHKIFDIFQTLNTKDRKSSGVGLSIVKKIVEIYHGAIEIDSEPSKGTTFKFTIHKEPETANQILDERK